MAEDDDERKRPDLNAMVRTLKGQLKGIGNAALITKLNEKGVEINPGNLMRALSNPTPAVIQGFMAIIRDERGKKGGVSIPLGPWEEALAAVEANPSSEPFAEPVSAPPPAPNPPPPSDPESPEPPIPSKEKSTISPEAAKVDALIEKIVTHAVDGMVAVIDAPDELFFVRPDDIKDRRISREGISLVNASQLLAHELFAMVESREQANELGIPVRSFNIFKSGAIPPRLLTHFVAITADAFSYGDENRKNKLQELLQQVPEKTPEGFWREWEFQLKPVEELRRRKAGQVEPESRPLRQAQRGFASTLQEVLNAQYADIPSQRLAELLKLTQRQISNARAGEIIEGLGPADMERVAQLLNDVRPPDADELTGLKAAAERVRKVSESQTGTPQALGLRSPRGGRGRKG